jgi:hypothetical protein
MVIRGKERQEYLQKKSSNKRAIDARVRRRHANMLEDLEVDIEKMYGKPVSEWDFQELQIGRPRDENGRLVRDTGPPPAWITPAIMAEAQKRLKLMTRDRMGHYAGVAIEVMVKLMQSSRSDLVKFNAAKYVLDQIIGMPTQRVEIDESMSPAEFMADFLIELDGRKHRVIEGQVEEEDVDEEDDDDEEDE